MIYFISTVMFVKIFIQKWQMQNWNKHVLYKKQSFLKLCTGKCLRLQRAVYFFGCNQFHMENLKASIIRCLQLQYYYLFLVSGAENINLTVSFRPYALTGENWRLIKHRVQQAVDVIPVFILKILMTLNLTLSMR